VVDRGFEPRSVQTKKIYNWCLRLLHKVHDIKKQTVVGSELG
jgi:hypothetical protein